MLTLDQEYAVSEAIDAAVSGTLAEVHVAVEDAVEGDVDERLTDLWAELDLDDVGLLVLVAVAERQVRVMAGARLMLEAGDAFWEEVSEAVASGFRDGDPVAGVRRALGPVGPLLRRVAPAPAEAGE